MYSDRPRPGPETDRLIGELVRVGTVEAVFLEEGKAVIRIGEVLTPPIDWLTPIGDTTLWMPPTPGSQVLVLAPEADPEQAVILGGLPSSAFAHLFKGVTLALRLKDGALITYDPDAQQLRLDLPGAASLTAPNGIVLEGDVRIDGDLQVSGAIHAEADISSDGDVLADEISLTHHVHGNVAAGAAKTGKPQ